MKKIIAEFFGTATLILFGCGAAVLGGDHVGQLGIAFAFGLAIVAMAYAIGPVSGCHINPAISLGAFIAGRMTPGAMLQYWAAQFTGALAGAGVLYFIACGDANYSFATHGLGQNGWGPGYLGEYTFEAAFLLEVVMTAIFVVVFLGATQNGAPTAMAGLAIGLTLTAIHIVGIRATGVSVNPARSFGPALIVGGQALSQLWLFLIAPMIGAGLGGALFGMKLLSADAD
ncbi:MAG: aquaporin [Parvularculaceae bacterium]